ncbi:MAG: hypothetical protein Q4F57_07880 [Weeksellaceae bacterium]|nr:hypothetical protein [Weeksellaceae bacterium]
MRKDFLYDAKSTKNSFCQFSLSVVTIEALDNQKIAGSRLSFAGLALDRTNRKSILHI